MRGELGERFRYDVSVGLGRSRIDYTMRESLNASLNAAAFEANPQLRLVLLTHPATAPAWFCRCARLRR